MWAEFAKDRVITLLGCDESLKRVLPTSEETGLEEAMTRSANENIQKVKEYNKLNYTINSTQDNTILMMFLEAVM